LFHLLLWLILPLASADLRAQDDDWFGLVRNPGEISSLSVQFDREGAAKVFLSVPHKLADPTAIRQALIESFSFPLVIDETSQHNFDDDENEGRGNLPFTLIDAHGEKPVSSQDMVSRASMRMARLAQILKPLGVKTLWVTVVFTRPPPNLKVTGASQAGGEGVVFSQIKISTANPGAAALDFSWGYRPHDVGMLLVPTGLFVLVPLILTLWMSWSVLKMQDRPAEMWSRYFRYLAWLINLIWLVWFPIYSWSRSREIIAAAIGPAGKLAIQLIDVSFYFAPPVIVTVLCHLLSGRVYRRVRGAEWSPADVVRRVILASFIWIVPLFFLILVIGSLSVGSRYAGLSLIMGGAVWLAIAGTGSRLLRLRSATYAITCGELRNRIFDLAAKAGVLLSQVYVLPEHKAQMSNAFARSDNSVALTASLLKHLSKREVDAIMAHEIGHLKEKHPQRKATITMGTIIVANIFGASLTSLIDLQRWAPAMFSLAIASSIFVLHFLSRGNERHADAIGINLTGDPAAFISGLAKISRLNLMPLHTGGWGESLSTHPRTLGRLEDIARVHGIQPERLQELVSGDTPAEDHYLPFQADEAEARVFSTEFKRAYLGRIAWLVLAAIVGMPLLAAFLLSRLHLQGAMSLLTYLGAALVTIALYQLLRNFMMSWGFGSVEQRVRAKLTQKGFADAANAGLFVGMAPAAQPRKYERCPFWDVGVLSLVNDQLFYLGEETQFALGRAQIVDTRVVAVEPAWVPRTALFIDWRDEARGSSGTFYLMPAAVRSVIGAGRELDALDDRIGVWLKGAEASPLSSASIPSLSSPMYGAVTSEPVKTRFDPLLVLRGALVLLLLNSLLTFALNIPFWSGCYAKAVLVVIVVLDELPKLFHSGLAEKPPDDNSSNEVRNYRRGAWAESSNE
jgi:Zn-dependent protease with chaperone function